MSPAPIICLPGLGADERLFAPQLDAFPNAVVPAWPTPRADDDVDAFADRLLDELVRAGTWRAKAVVLGFSFGGQVALSIARAIATGRSDAPPPAALVLVSAPRRTESLTRSFRRQVRLAPLVPDRVLAWAARAVVAPRFARACGLDDEQAELLGWMADDLDVAAFRALSRIACRWTFTDEDEAAVRAAGIRIEHLHAIDDPVIPAPPASVTGVRRLPERAHLLTWTHVDAVAEALDAVAPPGVE